MDKKHEKLKKKTINVLLIEDNEDYADFLKLILNQTDSQSTTNNYSEFEITHANQLIKGMNLIKNSEFDIILLNLHLSDSEGLVTLTRLLSFTKQVPIVILSAHQ